jgi:hypothetical protein
MRHTLDDQHELLKTAATAVGFAGVFAFGAGPHLAGVASLDLVSD